MSLMIFSWSEMQAWASLTKRRLDPHDIDAIRAIDRAYVERHQPKTPAPKQSPTVKKR